MARPNLWLVLAALVLLPACGVLRGCGLEPPDQSLNQGDPAALDLAATPLSDRTRIAFLGNSITAGYGLTMAQAYPALIGQMFASEGYRDIEIENVGVSGDTSAGGLRRLEQVLRLNVKVLVLSLGANDALRGLSIAQTRDNLTAIIENAFAGGAEVMLVGMEAPTNYGDDYRAAFRDMYGQIALNFGRRLTFVPFLLEGVGGVPDLNQGDGIHPNEQGQKVIAEHLYPPLRNMVDMLPMPGSQ